jgi:hypothetical protein
VTFFRKITEKQPVIILTLTGTERGPQASTRSVKLFKTDFNYSKTVTKIYTRESL